MVMAASPRAPPGALLLISPEAMSVRANYAMRQMPAILDHVGLPYAAFFFFLGGVEKQ